MGSVCNDHSDTKRSPRHRSDPKLASQNMKRRPAQLPEPWLFNSEKLLRELDRCREMVLLIPATTHETHFACNIAINSIWNLSEQLRYLLGLHREGQRSFAQKGAAETPKPGATAVPGKREILAIALLK